MEEYERVEDREGGIVEYACEDNILYVLQAVRVVDLLADVWFFDVDDLLESRVVREVLSVIRFVARKVGVICTMSVVAFIKRLQPPTLQRANDT